MRRVLVVVGESLLPEDLDRVLGALSWADADLDLLHVVDTRPLREFDLAAGGLPGRSGQTSERRGRMGALGAEAGARILADAAAAAAPRLPAVVTVRPWQRTGIPEHEILAAAHEIGAGLIVLGATGDPAAPPPPPPGRHRRNAEPRGPADPPRFPHRHLSPTARFVVDHAPCDVMVIYGGTPSRTPER